MLNVNFKADNPDQNASHSSDIKSQKALMSITKSSCILSHFLSLIQF